MGGKRTRDVVDLAVDYDPDPAALLVLVLRDILGSVRVRHGGREHDFRSLVRSFVACFC